MAARKIRQSSCATNEKAITHLGPYRYRPDPPPKLRTAPILGPFQEYVIEQGVVYVVSHALLCMFPRLQAQANQSTLQTQRPGD